MWMCSFSILTGTLLSNRPRQQSDQTWSGHYHWAKLYSTCTQPVLFDWQAGRFRRVCLPINTHPINYSRYSSKILNRRLAVDGVVKLNDVGHYSVRILQSENFQRCPLRCAVKMQNLSNTSFSKRSLKFQAHKYMDLEADRLCNFLYG